MALARGKRVWRAVVEGWKEVDTDVRGDTGNFRFEVSHRSRKPGSRARVGKVVTPHGSFLTPGFVPVGTNASMKCISTETMDNIYRSVGASSLMFCNTYHLMLHPGSDLVKQGVIRSPFPSFRY